MAKFISDRTSRSNEFVKVWMSSKRGSSVILIKSSCNLMITGRLRWTFFKRSSNSDLLFILSLSDCFETRLSNGIGSILVKSLYIKHHNWIRLTILAHNHIWASTLYPVFLTNIYMICTYSTYGTVNMCTPKFNQISITIYIYIYT